MAAVTYNRIQTNDSDLNRVQDGIATVINTLGSVTAVNNSSQTAAASSGVPQAFLGGNLIQYIALTAGQDNLVAHLLGRQLVFWILAGQSANANVWSPGSAQLGGSSATTSYINLQCSASCTVAIVVN